MFILGAFSPLLPASLCVHSPSLTQLVTEAFTARAVLSPGIPGKHGKRTMRNFNEALAGKE